MLVALVTAVAMTALCAQKSQDPAALVPANTIIYCGTQNVRAAAQASKASAMQMILAEPEVKAFLQKPVAAADKALQDAIKESGLAESGGSKFSLNEMVSGSAEGPPLGRMFVALTHLNLMPPAGDKPGMPDVGLVAGVELLNPDDIAMVKALWARIPLPEETANYNGHDYLVKTEPSKGFGVELVFLGNTAIASTSDKALHDTIDRFDGKSAAGSSLADSVEYRKLVTTAGSFPADASSLLVRVPPLADLLRASLAMGALSSPELGEMLPKINTIIDNLGLKAVKYAGSVSFRDGDGKVHSTSLVAMDKSVNGLISRCVSASEPVDLELAKGVPGNCISMSLASIGGLGDVWDFLLSSFESIAPDEYAQFQGMLKQVMGERDLRNDIVANLHGAMTSFSLPGDSPTGTPTSVMRVGLDRPQDFPEGMKALVKGLSAMFSPESPAMLNESTHADKPFYELDVSRTALAMVLPLQPAFAIDGNELVGSLDSAKTLKSALNGAAGEGTITDNKDFMAFANDIVKQGELHGLSYTDNAKEFGAVYTQLTGPIAMLSGGLGDLPVDLALLPSGQSISKHLAPSYGGQYMTEEGSVLVGRSLQQFQLGDFMPLFLTTGVLIATRAGQEGMSAEPRVVDEKERVTLDLAQLSAGITIYKLSEGGYPAGLDDLVKPLADYPDGCLQTATLPVDPWGNAYQFKLNEKGKPFLWSMGPDGVDQQGSGDDITRQK